MSRPSTPGETAYQVHVLRIMVLALALIPVWLPVLPYGTDMPQHAEQIRQAHDLAWMGGWHLQLLLDPFTPYLLTYLLGALIMPLTGIVVALKLLMSAAILLTFLGVDRLLRTHQAERPLAIYAVLGCYGMSYQWGFLPFSIAIGFVLLLLATTHGRNISDSRSRVHPGEILLALAILLTHGLATLIAGGLLIAQALADTRAHARLRAYSLTLLMIIPIVLWSLLHETGVPGLASNIQFGLSLTHSSYNFYREISALTGSDVWSWGRLTGFFPRIFGTTSGPLTTLAGLAICAMPFLFGYRLTKNRQRLMLFGAICLAMLIAPTYINGTIFVSERLSLLFFCLFPLVLRATPDTRKNHALGTLVISALCIIGLQVMQSTRQDEDNRNLLQLLATLPPDQQMLYMAEKDRSPDRMAPVFLHSGHWYGALHGGLVDPSFATTNLQPVRYKPLQRPFVTISTQLEWGQQKYHWDDVNGDQYQLLMIRGEKQRLEVFTGCLPADQDLISVGHWLVWAKTRSQSCIPETRGK